MIRNLLLIMFSFVCLSIVGIFIVNDNEVAVLKRNNTYSIYHQGIYWRIPFYDELTYSYVNSRISERELSQDLVIDVKPYNILYNFNWKVTNPVKYIQYTDNNSKQDLNNLIESSLKLQLDSSSKAGDLLAVLNQVSTLHYMSLEQLGIEVTEINILSIDSDMILPNVVKNNSYAAESEFEIAKNIKESSDTEYQRKLNELKNKNEKFFNIYMKIYQLQHSNVDKKSIPPLESLVAN